MIYYFVKCDSDGNLNCDDFTTFTDEPYFFRMEYLSEVVAMLNKTTKYGEYFFWTSKKCFGHMRVAK